MTDDTPRAEETRQQADEPAADGAAAQPAALVGPPAPPQAEARPDSGEPAAKVPEPAAQDEPRPEGKPQPARKPRAKGDSTAGGKAKAKKAPEGESAREAEGKGKKERAPKAASKPKAAGKAKAQRKAEAEDRPKPEAKPAPVEDSLPPRLKARYREEILPELMRELELDNPMAVPRVHKVVINMGVGVATEDPKALEGAVKELAEISGQQPAITRARKSIAAFKVREKNPVGCRVTLRGDRMYEFLDRLLNVALPRIRDFRGLSPRSFDGRGNYTMGIREQLIFPELNIDDIERVRGMDITITTTAKTDEAGRALLTKMGLPLRES